MNLLRWTINERFAATMDDFLVRDPSSLFFLIDYLYRRFSPFAGANPDHFINGCNKNFTIAYTAGLGR